MKRTFTFNLRAAFLMLTMLCMLPAMAAVSSPTDFFGKWKFTGKVEVTDAGKADADKFVSESDVTIQASSNGIYKMEIIGVAGTTGRMDVNNIAFDKGQISILNPNSYVSFGLSQVHFSNTEGNNPYDRNVSFNMDFTYNAEATEITIPDFTVVRVDKYEEPDAVILAKYTECKLVLVEREEIAVEDISGDYNFESVSYPLEGFTTKFAMNLKATDDKFKAYAVTITFEGYAPLNLQGSFDGNTLTIPFNEVYLNEEKTLMITTFSPAAKEGVMSFNKNGYNLILKDAWQIRKQVEKEPEEPGGETKLVWEPVQNFLYGTAVKVIDLPDFAGTYKATCTIMDTNPDDGIDAATQYPSTFDVVITDNGDGKFYITEFMGQNVSGANYGGIAGTPTDGSNVLNFASGKLLAMIMEESDLENYVYVYDKVMNQTLDPEGTIEFTYNEEDGTATLGDFMIVRGVYGSNENKNVAYCYGVTLTKVQGDGVDAARVEKPAVYAADGAICVAGGAELPLTVYNMAGQVVFHGVASRVAVPAKGVYIVKSGAASVKVAL